MADEEELTHLNYSNAELKWDERISLNNQDGFADGSENEKDRFTDFAHNSDNLLDQQLSVHATTNFSTDQFEANSCEQKQFCETFSNNNKNSSEEYEPEVSAISNGLDQQYYPVLTHTEEIEEYPDVLNGEDHNKQKQRISTTLLDNEADGNDDYTLGDNNGGHFEPLKADYQQDMGFGDAFGAAKYELITEHELELGTNYENQSIVGADTADDSKSEYDVKHTIVDEPKGRNNLENILPYRVDQGSPKQRTDVGKIASKVQAFNKTVEMVNKQTPAVRSKIEDNELPNKGQVSNLKMLFENSASNNLSSNSNGTYKQDYGVGLSSPRKVINKGVFE